MTILETPQHTLSAARLVGRVGGLALALGVGAGMFTGVAVACADSSDSPSAPRSTSAQNDEGGADSGPSSRGRRGSVTRTRGLTAAESDVPDAGPVTSLRATRISRSAADEVPTAPPAVEPSAPAAAAAAVAPAATNNDSPAPAPTAAVAQVQAAAQGSSIYQITVDPTLAWGAEFRSKEYPGVLVGSLNAYSALPLLFTTISQPSLGGKLGAKANAAPSKTVFDDQGGFFYLPDSSALTDASKTESFKIMAAQQTDFDNFLVNLPLIGGFMPSLLVSLHRTPFLGDLLTPIIGASQIVTFNANPNELAAGRPTAFTTKVESFDGLKVSTNFFPAVNVALGLVDSAPTILQGPGLGAPGNTDVSNPYAQLALFPWTDPPTPRQDQMGSLTPGLPVLREDAWTSNDSGPSYDGGGGYNVISWDPRGEWATRDKALPPMQIDNPFYEGRDTRAIISWAYSGDNPAKAQVQMESPDDPLIGMTGGSYGGGIQWVTAGTDPRVDAIAPEISWNSLISALYPNYNQFKTGWGTLLGLALLATGAQFNKELYSGIATGITLGWLSQTAQAVMSSAGPTALLSKIDIPTLIFQGEQDGLFQLQESVNNAQALLNNGFDPETKMTWFCGGHGSCLDPLNPAQDDRGLVDNLRWFDQYLAGNPLDPADDIPAFQWYDQTGAYGSSDKLPFEAGFNEADPYTTTGDGGRLGVWPLIGGSGPGSVANISKLITFPNATTARNALNVSVAPPVGAEVVGAPTLSFNYSGIGTTRTIYAQLVDNATGRVLGNVATPIPVTFDGKQHSLTIPMANIVYAAGNSGSLTLQITSSATNFENFTSFGSVKISDIKLDLPIRAQ